MKGIELFNNILGKSTSDLYSGAIKKITSMGQFGRAAVNNKQSIIADSFNAIRTGEEPYATALRNTGHLIAPVNSIHSSDLNMFGNKYSVFGVGEGNTVGPSMSKTSPIVKGSPDMTLDSKIDRINTQIDLVRQGIPSAKAKLMADSANPEYRYAGAQNKSKHYKG